MPATAFVVIFSLLDPPQRGRVSLVGGCLGANGKTGNVPVDVENVR
jgi:hypothetical protein